MINPREHHIILRRRHFGDPLRRPGSAIPIVESQRRINDYAALLRGVGDRDRENRSRDKLRQLAGTAVDRRGVEEVVDPRQIAEWRNDRRGDGRVPQDDGIGERTRGEVVRCPIEVRSEVRRRLAERFPMPAGRTKARLPRRAHPPRRCTGWTAHYATPRRVCCSSRFPRAPTGSLHR